MKEADNKNLYLFVRNSSVNVADWLGCYTLDDAENSLKKKKIPPDFSGLIFDKYSDQQKFNEWIVLEQTDSSWLATIPDCPDKICVVKGMPKDYDNGQWESIGNADQKYHKGAKWCMRSTPSSRGAAQQCCYNKDGELIKSGLGAGTPDRQAAAIKNDFFRNHYKNDVVPFKTAYKLDGKTEGTNVRAYLRVRPPSQGDGSCYK